MRQRRRRTGLMNLRAAYYSPITRLIMNGQVVLESSAEGGYAAFVPALPGCISEGDNKDEAIKNIQAAIALYLEPENFLEETLIESEFPAVPCYRSPLPPVLDRPAAGRLE